MSDDRDARTHGDDAALLGAYLDADLDPHRVEALERRLAAEPPLARQLEDIRSVREALAGSPVPPDGFEARLRARLAQERAGRTRHDTADRGRRDRATHPPARPRPSAARHRPRIPAWSAAAAGVLLVAVLGGVAVVAGVGGVADRDVADVAADAEAEAPALEAVEDAAPEGAAPEEEAAEEEADEEEADERLDTLSVPHADAGPDATDTDGPARRSVASVSPEVAVVDSTAQAISRYATRDEVAAWRGAPSDDAAALADEAAADLRTHAPWPDGRRPDACLEAVTEPAEPVVPVVVERVRTGGRDAIAYVLLTAADGDALTTADAVVVDEHCDVLLRADLPAP